MVTRCTRDLATHWWRSTERLMLGLTDREGFYPCFLVWVCAWCQRRVWADGVLHVTTPPMTPVQWEKVTEDTTNPWQQQVERTSRWMRQQATVQATIQQWTLHTGKGSP